jgi:hypothetical protein
MKNTRKLHRIAIAALSASLVLPIAPVFGQDAPAAAPPPVVTISPPPPVITAPPPPAATAPPPRIDIVPQVPITRAAPPPAATTRTTVRTIRAAPVRTRAAAPVRRTAPAPAPAPIAAPVAAAPAPVAAPPVAALPAPAPVEPVAQPVETAAPAARSMLPWLIGGALLLGVLAFFFLRRRRDADEEVYEESVYEEPIAAAPDPDFARPEPVAPAYVAPVAAAAVAAGEPVTADEVVVDDADQADVDALAADSAPVAGRPWLEFLLRPVRAGTSQDDTIVQFELTVGNTGTVAAKDVRISTWMFAAGEGTDMERMLIDPPADATVSEVDIAAGDGTRVDGEISLPKTGHAETVLPVVVADARYRLPDGREGRTSASFAIGLPEGDGIAPFQLDRASGLIEAVEARLHGEPQRV